MWVKGFVVSIGSFGDYWFDIKNIFFGINWKEGFMWLFLHPQYVCVCVGTLNDMCLSWYFWDLIKYLMILWILTQIMEELEWKIEYLSLRIDCIFSLLDSIFYTPFNNLHLLSLGAFISSVLHFKISYNSRNFIWAYTA